MRYDPRLILLGSWRRFDEDKGFIVAASLAFTSMLSLVPMVTVAFGLFAAFPAVRDILTQAREWAVETFVPGIGEEVGRQITGFIDNASSLPVIGIAILCGSALLLLVEIEQAMNGIWRTGGRHGWGVRLLGFWAILTGFPLIAAISIWGFIAAAGSAGEAVRGSVGQVMPFAVGWVVCFAIYVAFPARTVAKIPAMIGAGAAALALYGAKVIFAAYLATKPMQYAIYGALAALPLLQIWLFVCWVVILLGAALAAEIEDHMLPAPPAPPPESVP